MQQGGSCYKCGMVSFEISANAQLDSSGILQMHAMRKKTQGFHLHTMSDPLAGQVLINPVPFVAGRENPEAQRVTQELPHNYYKERFILFFLAQI